MEKTLQLMMTYDKPGTAGGGVIEIQPEELKEFANKLNLNNSIIEWKWAFRYQWIISKV